MNFKIAIIGGGLSGLYAAYLLEKFGIHDYVLIEAKPNLGGRIYSQSLSTLSNLSTYDLGGTWYWPDIQPLLHSVLKELGLKVFPQFEDGETIYDRSPQSSPQRIEGFKSVPEMYRVEGGMQALINALELRLNPKRIFKSTRISNLSILDNKVTLEAESAHGLPSINCEYVLLALPPRLASHLSINPTLPQKTLQCWKQTSTWMAPHAKYLAVFDHPFWRDAGLSGQARSVWGPLAEIHDATDSSGNGALFGFLNIPAKTRSMIEEKELLSSCRAQLVRLFGGQAAHPRAEFIKDWARDPCVATDDDLTTPQVHDPAQDSYISRGEWENRIFCIASEWSRLYPGYIAGAIDASTRGTFKLKNLIQSQMNKEFL